MNPVALRLLNQQLICPQFSDPSDVVEYMGAIQAQEYRMMRWAVTMRTKHPSTKAFKTAYDEGHIIRTHLMRGTWQLVSASDYRWMISLCGPKGIAVTKGWMHSSGISIDDDELTDIGNLLLQAASDLRSATKDDFKQALAAKDIVMDDHRLSFHIRMLEYSGKLCSGDLLPMKATYAVADEKIGHVGTIDHDEALMLLTRKYFQSRQPATLDDYVWWSGLSASLCRRGIEMLGNEIHHERWHGHDFLLTDSCRTRGFRHGRYILLPSYDEYLIAYKSRAVVLPQHHAHHAHSNNGIFYPVVVHDGIVCGNWSPFRQSPTISFFDGETHSDDLLAEWERYQKGR